MAKTDKNQLWRKINKPLASLKLAVVIILAMGIMSAWGTIVESNYNDARRAQELVYHSWYSFLIFFMLAVNLIAVMIDRWPWKKRHIGFLAAHIGIITLMAGSLLTYFYGVDGSMSIDIGTKKRRLAIPSATDIIVYSSLGAGGYRNVHEEQVNFLRSEPTGDNPYVVELANEKIVVDKFQPYSRGEVKVVASDLPADGPALRFQLANARVKETNWLILGSRPMNSVFLGPAQVVLARKGFYSYTAGNILLLEYEKGNDELTYKVYTDRVKKMTSQGKIKAGGNLETGWMGLTFRLLSYIPKAKEKYVFSPVLRGGDGISPSIRIKFQDKEHWLGLNSTVKLFTDSQVYVFGYVNRLIELDFDIELKDFQVGRYQGSRRAASYASDVYVIDDGKKIGPIHIAMNEPLDHKGFTFYQASFSENKFGKPTTSVLSVNRDPGRPWKNLGSLLIVLGAIYLFYFSKKKKKGKKA